jgi:hypothetical protein
MMTNARLRGPILITIGSVLVTVGWLGGPFAEGDERTAWTRAPAVANGIFPIPG